MGTMLGAGDARYGTANAVLLLITRIGAAYILAFALGMGLDGVFQATGVSFTINMFFTLARFYSGVWKKKAVVKAAGG